MKNLMITLVAAWLGLQAALAQPQLVDCQCLFSHAQGILRTNACQAVVPDLCQFKECFTSTAVPPPTFTCSQTPTAGTVVGPGSYSITVTVSANGQASSCTLPFQVDPPTTGCNGLTLTCSSNKTVECSSTWTFDPPTATGGCPNSQGLPPNVTIVVVSTTTNGTCPKVITRTWKATDDCGVTAMCSQTVTVVDTTPPQLNCNCLRDVAQGVLRTNDCVSGIVPDLCRFRQCFSDNCGPLTCTQSPTAGTVVGLGIHPITVTVTDCAGNKASCTLPFRVSPLTQTNVWNTGMGGPSGSINLPPGTPDPNYILISSPPGGCSGPAQVQDPTTIPAPPWIANGPGSQWIGPALDTSSCQPGVYHYRLCFYLPCTDGAAILGQWSSDDWGTMHLNGQPTGYTVPSTQYPNNGFDILHPVAITNGFVCGNNCLDFYVTNSVIYTGLRAELTNVFNDCCCQPAQKVLTVFTGLDATGAPAPQGSPASQFSFTCAPAGMNLTTPVVTQPSPFWMPNGPNSQWIGPGAPLNNYPGGVYCYTVNFNIPCPQGVPIKANLTGQWMADDSGTIYLNGNPTGNTLPPTWAFTNWQAINITSGFVSGVNTLTFYVTNGSASPTGMRLELTGSASCCACTNICTVSISCPPDIDRTICSTKEIVVYPPPTASSSCGSSVNVVCTPASGSSFSLGTNTVNCTATDAMGNSASCSFKVILRPDITAPIVDCACLQLQTRPVRACNALIPDFCKYRDCYSDNCTPNAALICSQSPAAGTPVGPGTYNVTVTVTDAAGNSSQCQVQFTVIAPVDTRVWNTGASGAQAANFVVVQTPSGPANIPVVLTAPAGGAWLANTPASSWVSFTPNSSGAAAGVYLYRLTFNLPCTAGASISGRFLVDDSARIWLNGVPTAAYSASYSTWTPVNLTSGFVPGVNTLDIYVTNAIIWTGLRTELTNSYTCCCPEAIAIKCPQKLTGWVCSPNSMANVPFTIGAATRCPSSNITVSVTCIPPSPGPFPLGTTTVNCTATDSLGNQATCSFPVTVVRDTFPPIITCPAPITIATCSNSVRAYYKATAKDDCSAVTIACVPPSGSLFNAGTITIVTCTATDACGNKSSCSFPVKILNNLIWQTLPAGIPDCYSLAGFEPASPGPCLTSAYPGGPWKNFDVTTVNRWVGHTWNFPASWNILAANLATRARPPVNGCYGISGNDSIQLGLNNCGTPAWLWARYFGSGNASPGLVDSQWCNGSGCAFNFSFNLAALPPVSGPAINLLPHMNSTKRLDYFAQDDTTVDYAHLRVLRCAPQAVLGGFDTTLHNATIAIGPINKWCIVRDNPNVPTWTANISLGGAPAVAQSMRYRCKPSDWDLKSNVKARMAGPDGNEGEGVFAGLSLTHAVGSPVAELHLSTVPPGVTEVQVLMLDNGTVLSSQTFPASSDAVLARFSDETEYYGVMFTRGEGFFDISRVEGQLGNQVCVRFLPEPAALPYTGLEIQATGIDALDVGPTQIRSANKDYAITLTGDAIGLALDGQVSISPLDPDSTAPIGLRLRFPPNLGSSGEDGTSAFRTNELTAYIQAQLRQGTPAGNTNPPTIRFTAIGTFSDMTSRPLPPVIFTGSPYGFGVSSAQDGATQPIHRVQVWSNATLVVDVPNPASVECRSLPPIYRPIGTPWFVDADICHRFPFYNREVVRVNGVEYSCTELRISLPSLTSVGESLAGLSGIDVEATGADSLVLSRVIVGPVPLRFLPPERFTDEATGQPGNLLRIGWDQPWPALEGAPTILGPWRPIATDGTEVIVPVPGGVPSQFYRLRE